MSFTHLHLHTEYSLLDGACRINRLMDDLKQKGMSAAAITDHGAMFGAVEFYQAAKKNGIKPIIGCECYVASRSRFDKLRELDARRYHLVLLCKNETGYRNLIAMVSKAWTEGFYTKPRIDKELLKEHHEGLIALSACLSGEIPRLLAAGDYDGAKETAKWYRDLFGDGNYYLEVQNHGLREELELIPDLVRLSKDTGIPLVATNDAHYLNKDDAEVQQVLICIQTNHTLGEETGLEFTTDEFYVKTEDEMRALFPDLPAAIDNTQVIAEQCNVDFTFGQTILPHFEVPNHMNHFEYFKNQCFYGLCQKFGDNPPQQYVDRLNYELGVIDQMGYVDYFLIVHDFIRYAKEKGIPVGPGRGSGAGSLAAYCIGITGIDPMRYNLLFERFLNPERVSMPDFDIDFCYVRRQEVIDYVIRKYGADHVAQIVTFGTLAARAAVRDVGRVLGLPYGRVDSVAKLIPMELKITIDKALQRSADLKALYDADPEVRRLIDLSRKVEGMPRHASTHAAGVVITRESVSYYVPLAVNDESVVTQFTMTTLEQLGLLKMDFLGLRTLTVIDDTVKLIRRRNPQFSLEDIDVTDEKTYRMLSTGKTDGVFQFESAGMRSVLSRLKPESLEDLIAVISLYRPGPADSIDTYINNRHHPEQTTYPCEQVKDILSVTYGCMVYQEQVMEICRKVAGYSYGAADLVRRAMAKKKWDVMEKEREHFLSGAKANGIAQSVAQSLFDQMSSFANYAFNKSHAAAYAFVSFQTAWLKCHYPCELLAATLTSVLDSSAKVATYISEAQRLGIDVLPPHVNESVAGFSTEDGSIRFGLLAIKNLGRGFIRTILSCRNQSKFRTFYDFCKRTSGREFNKRAVESLIRCGALDGLDMNRRQMIYMLPIIVSQLETDARHNVAGQIGFFDEGSLFAAQNEPAAPAMEELPRETMLHDEKEITGLYLSGHPMAAYDDVAASVRADRMCDLLLAAEGQGGYKDGGSVRLFGLIEHVEKKTTKNGGTMAFVRLEDRTGSIECLVFSRLFQEKQLLLREGEIVFCEGRLSLREEKEPTVVLDRLEPNPKNVQKRPSANRSDQPAKKQRAGFFVRLRNAEDPRLPKLQTLTEIFAEGMFPVYTFDPDSATYRFFGTLENCDAVFSELQRLFGSENVVRRG